MPDTNTSQRRLGVWEAKRWLKDKMGYSVLRYMLNHQELTNKAWESEFKNELKEWQFVTFVYVGNHTLVVNHTKHALYWQE